jgi:type II secretory pathway predicted ATPase ExeA
MRLEFLAQHHGAGLLTGEVGAGKSTAARVFSAALNPSLYKILYVHFSSGSALDLLRQIALELDLEPAHFRGDLVRQIAGAIVRLNQSKKQHPILGSVAKTAGWRFDTLERCPSPRLSHSNGATIPAR